MADVKVRTILKYGLEMRSSFDFSRLKFRSWFPRHMHSALYKIQAKMRDIDCILEVHDARIPFSGRNKKLSDVGIIKPSILVMNKVDLIDPKYQEAIRAHYLQVGVKEVVFTNCKLSHHPGIASIVPSLLRQVSGTDRFNRSEKPEYNMMVLGIPNVGKSSIINCLRAQNMQMPKATPVASWPGMTMSVMEKIKINRKPMIFIRDTPGVMPPAIPNPEKGLRMALANTVLSHLVGDELMADYLLYCLNCGGQHAYVDKLGLSEPTDNIRKLLVSVAIKFNFVRNVRINMQVQMYPDLQLAASHFVELWRKGKFGCSMLDMVISSGGQPMELW